VLFVVLFVSRARSLVASIPGFGNLEIQTKLNKFMKSVIGNFKLMEAHISNIHGPTVIYFVRILFFRRVDLRKPKKSVENREKKYHKNLRINITWYQFMEHIS
jgi:hypothetical protein